MNREQRRRAQRQAGEIKMASLNAITFAWQMTPTECESMAAYRLSMNLSETGHPFHHLTASGVIVDTDPTLEYYLKRLTSEKQQETRAIWQARIQPTAQPAIPVNRTFYGHDPYEGR